MTGAFAAVGIDPGSMKPDATAIVLRTSSMGTREKVDGKTVDDQVMDVSTRLIMSPGAARQISPTLSSAVATIDKWSQEPTSHPATRPPLDPSIP